MGGDSGNDDGDENGAAVKAGTLELGVGLNTPSVLQRLDEDLVSESSQGRFRLIRVGMDAAGCVPWELEEEDLAIGISGDIKLALDFLTFPQDQRK